MRAVAQLCLLACCLVYAAALDPVVLTNDGAIRGVYLRDLQNIEYEAYLGIPFAKPPLGSLRFANPQPNDPWTTEYNATSEKPACLQVHLLYPGNPLFGSEDCLYMNVYKPTDAGDGLPVMFYIHGGGYFGGSASKSVFGPERFMHEKKVILVVIQYRLGIFGFLSTGDAAAPGNFGMKDQSMALRWVHKNIRSFGGDPQKVTIFGESAGGASVQMHMMSPLSKGLFQRAIMMSGSIFGLWTSPFPDPIRLAIKHAKIVGITDADSISTTELVNRLRAIDGNLLCSTVANLKIWFVHPLIIYRPVLEPIDNPESFLCEDPQLLWETGRHANVPLLTGTVPNDAAAVSLPILNSTTLIAQLNANISYLLPLLAGVVPSDAAFQLLKQRFYPNRDPVAISYREDPEFMRMFSESWLFYPVVKSIKLRKTGRHRAPTLVYSYEFRGRYSYSTTFGAADVDYGVCHQDELLYLFYTPQFFPNFPAGSPESVASKKWLKFFIDFATDSDIPKKHLCPPDCRITTFANSNNTNSPVLITTDQRLDDDMYTFWDNFFKTFSLQYM